MGRSEPKAPATSSTAAPIHPRYEIGRRLGAGGHGTVWVARDRFCSDREVALKICAGAADTTAAFNEFRVLRELRHASIPEAYDFGRLPDGQQRYFCLEFVRGDSLERRAADLRNSALSGDLTPCLRVFVQVADALSYLHDRGLLHLDLKPANIVFAHDQLVKLVDFGLFRNVARGESDTPIGTIHYAAPELLDGKAVDARVDLYALGMTMYRVLAGRHPFVGRSLHELAAQHRARAPAPLESVPEALSRLVLKLLAKDPRRRYQSAREVSRLLLEIHDGLDRSVEKPPGPLSSVLPAPDFVSRSEQLSAFFAWLDRFRSGSSSRMFLIEGAAETGKTRLLEACRTEALALDIRTIPVLTEGFSGREALGNLVRNVVSLRPSLRRSKTSYGFTFQYLGVSQHAKARVEIERSSAEQIHRRVLRESANLLREALEEPTLFVVDDLHRAGDLFRRFVDQLLAEESCSSGCAFAFVATSRSNPDREDDAGPGTNPSAISESIVTRVVVDKLGESDVLKALEPLRERLGDETLRRLVRLADGVPGRLARAIERCSSGSAGRLSDTEFVSRDLRDYLLDRVRELEFTELATLLCLAMVQQPLRQSDLESAVAQVESARMDGFPLSIARLRSLGLAAGVAAGLVLTQDLDAGEILESFDRDGLVDELRLALARVLARRSETVTSAAHLFLDAGCPDEGVPLAIVRSEKALANGRVEEAAGLLEKLRREAVAVDRRQTILESLGDCEERRGLFVRATEAYDEALAASRLPAETRARVLRKRGAVLQRRGATEDSRVSLESALSLLDSKRDRREQLHALGELATLELFAGDFDRANSYANRGLELLEELPDESTDRDESSAHQAAFLSIRGNVFLRQFDYDAAIEQLKAGLSAAEQTGSLSRTAVLLNNLGLAYRQSSRLKRAVSTYNRAAEIAQKIGEDSALFSISCNRAAVLARLGRRQDALTELASLKRLPHLAESARARLFWLFTRGLVARLEREDSHDSWSESVELAKKLTDPQFSTFGRLYWIENEIVHGRWKSARSLFDERRSTSQASAPPRAEGQDARHAIRLERHLQLWLDALTGHRERALSLWSELREEDSRNDRRPEPATRAHNELWGDLILARGLLELDHLDAASRLLRKLLTSFRKIQETPGIVECRLLLAELFLRKREPAKVRKWIEEARGSTEETNGQLPTFAEEVLLPILETRLALQEPRGDTSATARRLADARASIPEGGAREWAWLLDLVASRAGDSDANHRWPRARARFIESLATPDQTPYRERDHLARLGIDAADGEAAPQRSDERDALQAKSSGSLRSGTAVRRLLTLAAMRQSESVTEAIRHLVEGGEFVRAAVVLARDESVLACEGFDLSVGESLPAPLVRQIVSHFSGPVHEGFCAGLPGESGGPLSILYAEPKESCEATSDGSVQDLVEYLHLASLALFEPITRAARRSLVDTEETPGDDIATRTQSRPLTDLISSRSPKMIELVELVRRTRDSSLPVLLVGESGVGKDYLAQWIHKISPRRAGPFLSQNCAAIHAELLEADLFGYEAGAFTDAHRRKEGYLVHASGGTFYLDNVDGMTLETQSKLLRVLESGRVRPIGGEERSIDVRFIASAQHDLRALCERGEFRRDLYFRLAGLSLVIPPLREREEDIDLLITHFNRQSTSGGVTFTGGALEILRGYAWPGNVRELETLIRRLSIVSEGRVDEATVRETLGLRTETGSFPRWIFEEGDYDQVLQRVRREYLLYLFDVLDGDFDRIADALGTSKRNAYLRFSRSGLKPLDLRSKRH